ncbi:MAG TPA: hypothetical protein VK480_10970, partial [Solirubrobacterales bacterium]|nr:hypothetical protein [Solirubrobacterales bacterium]
MTRNAKALGLAIIAALALSAMVASAAQAAKYTATQYPASLTGNQSSTLVLTFNGARKFQCSGVTTSGTLKEASEEFTTTSEKTGCTTEIAGIKYPSGTTATCSIACEHISALTVTRFVCVGKCTHDVTVYKDAAMTEPLCVYGLEDFAEFKGVSTENLGGTNGVKLSFNLSGIPYKLLSGTALLCGAESSTATYTGALTYTAKNEKG